jgi:hypothetical protein
MESVNECTQEVSRHWKRMAKLGGECSVQTVMGEGLVRGEVIR